jgi:PIN domain nuclease of toxin-antitoxin system
VNEDGFDEELRKVEDEPISSEKESVSVSEESTKVEDEDERISSSDQSVGYFAVSSVIADDSAMISASILSRDLMDRGSSDVSNLFSEESKKVEVLEEEEENEGISLGDMAIFQKNRRQLKLKVKMTIKQFHRPAQKESQSNNCSISRHVYQHSSYSEHSCRKFQ